MSHPGAVRAARRPGAERRLDIRLRRSSANDNYFSPGRITDRILDQTWTVGSTKYSLGACGLVPAGGRLNLSVTRNATAGPTTQTGLLLLYDNAATKDAQPVRIS